MVQNVFQVFIFILRNPYMNILSGYEKIDFWKNFKIWHFRPFLLYFWAIFLTVKIGQKTDFSNFDFFGWECWGVEPIMSGGQSCPERPPEIIGLTPQHSQPKQSKFEKSVFWPIFTVRKIAQNYSKNGPKCQISKIFKNRFLHNDPRYEDRSWIRSKYTP